MLTKRETFRQLFHIAVGIITVIAIYFEIISSLAVFLMIVAGILVSIISKRAWLPFFSFFLKHFEREEMIKTFPGKGMIFFFVGVLLVMQLFEKNVALAAIMVLTFGDSVSHLVGARLGRIRNFFNGQAKLLEGTIAGTITGFFGALLFVPIPEAFFGSAAAMFAEVVKIDLNEKTLDDNLIVPLVAGTVMFLVGKYL